MMDSSRAWLTIVADNNENSDEYNDGEDDGSCGDDDDDGDDDGLRADHWLIRLHSGSPTGTWDVQVLV